MTAIYVFTCEFCGTSNACVHPGTQGYIVCGRASCQRQAQQLQSKNG